MAQRKKKFGSNNESIAETNLFWMVRAVVFIVEIQKIENVYSKRIELQCDFTRKVVFYFQG